MSIWPHITPFEAEEKLESVRQYSVVLAKAVERFDQFCGAVALANDSIVSEDDYLALKRNFLVLEDLWASIKQEQALHISILRSLKDELAVFKFLDPLDVEIIHTPWSNSSSKSNGSEIAAYQALLDNVDRMFILLEKDWVMAEGEYESLRILGERFVEMEGYIEDKDEGRRRMTRNSNQRQRRIAPATKRILNPEKDKAKERPSWRKKPLVLTGTGDVIQGRNAKFSTHKWTDLELESARMTSSDKDRIFIERSNPDSRYCLYSHTHGPYCSACASDRLGTRTVWRSRVGEGEGVAHATPIGGEGEARGRGHVHGHTSSFSRIPQTVLSPSRTSHSHSHTAGQFEFEDDGREEEKDGMSTPSPMWYERLQAIGDGPSHAYDLDLKTGYLRPHTHDTTSYRYANVRPHPHSTHRQPVTPGRERREDIVKVNYSYDDDKSRWPYTISIPRYHADRFARHEVKPAATGDGHGSDSLGIGDYMRGMKVPTPYFPQPQRTKGKGE